MNLRLHKIIAFIAILLLMVLPGCQSQGDRSLLKVRSEEILSITISKLPDSEQIVCTSSQIESFADAFNAVRKYDNTVGTTPPHRVEAVFSDGQMLTVWGYNQGFASMQLEEEEQQNITGEKLAQWFSENTDN